MAGNVNISAITIIVPTINRSDFVLRLLRYYTDNRFLGCILLGDSSNDLHAARIQVAVRELRNRLSVTYVDCRGLNDRLTLARLARAVATPYVVYMGDDDILIPSGLQRCIEFLEVHRDYVAANGTAMAVQLSNSGAHGGIVSLHPYPQPDLEAGTARERLQTLLAQYRVSLFSVHRAETWRAMWRHAEMVEDRTFGAELLPCCLSAVLGKIRHLDCLYLIRQSHDQIYHLPGFFEWIATPVWCPSFQAFLTRLAIEIARDEGEPVDTVTAWVHELFLQSYLARLFPAPQSRYPANRALRLVLRLIPGGATLWQILKKVPGTRPAWRILSAVLARRSMRRMSLRRVLRRVAPHGEEFLPVYRAITKTPSSVGCA